MLTESLTNSFIRRLEGDEIVTDFDCGDADLNDFITNEAQAYLKAKLAVTYVLCPTNNPSFVTSNKTGCRFITVDAYINAIPFYEKNGFLPLNSDDEVSDYTRLLYFDLNDLD